MTFVDFESLAPGSGIRLDPADWSVLGRSRPNVLVSGPDHATSAFIQALAPRLRSPVQVIAAEDLVCLGSLDGTLILRDVDALDAARQSALLEWLDETPTGRTQVVCTTTKPLYNHVQAGTFLDRLFYRLNVVSFEVSAE
jgi:hypothetical protein